MIKVSSVLVAHAIILVIMVTLKEVYAASESPFNLISASPAVLPYPTTMAPTPGGISDFFPTASAPYAMAYGPAPSSGEIIGRSTSAASASKLGLCYIVASFHLLILVLFFVTN